jgi:hypothetical protein
LRVPPPSPPLPPVTCVPGAQSPTPSALLPPPPPPPPPCSCHYPPHSTSCRHQPVSPASPGPLRYARYPVPPPLCSLTPPRSTRVSPPPPPPARAPGPRPRHSPCRRHRRCPRNRLHPPQQRAAAAGPCPRASSTPRYVRCRHRRSCFPNPPQTTRVPLLPPLVVRAPGIPAPARPLPPLLPQLLQPVNGEGIDHRHLPRHQVRVCRALPTARGRSRALILISSSPPPGTEACHIIMKKLTLQLILLARTSRIVI